MPGEPASGSTKTLAILSLVLGILSLIVFAALFAPGAIVCGTIAGSKGSAMGWVGMGLGVFGLVAWVAVLMFMEAA